MLLVVKLIRYAVVLAALLPVFAHAQGTVLASVKPLQLIAAAITDGVSTPQLLIPANQSPHNFNLRPSDMRNINAADIVLWVGPGLETYLSRVFAQRSATSNIIEIAALTDVQLLDLAPGEHEHGHSHDEPYDPHLWLSTHNAVAIATALHAELLVLDPDNGAVYTQNLHLFQDEVRDLQQRLSAQFAPLASSAYAVYHNGVQYFEKQLGIAHQFVLVPDHEQQPGIRHLLELRAQVQALAPSCLFDDINSNDATVATVFQNHPVRRVRLDTLGESVAVSRTAYVQMLTQLADAMQQCLSPQ